MSSLRVSFGMLEDKLQRHLHNPRRGSAADLSSHVAADGGVRSREIRAVERIEHLPAIAGPKSLRDPEIPVHPEIQIEVSGRFEESPARISKLKLFQVGTQAVPQLIWLGLGGLEVEVTVPLPLPALPTVRELRTCTVLLMSTETVVEL